MTDEPEVSEDEFEDEGYTPEPYLIHEDSVLIFDQAEFCERFNCWAAHLVDGVLYVLDRDTYQWRNVKEFGKASPSLKRVQ
jgi:hypothetical protein